MKRALAPLSLGACVLAAALAACSGTAGDDGATATAAGSGGGATSSAGAGGSPPSHDWTECQASDQAWVRRAVLALTGRKPWGQTEVNALEDVLVAVRKADGGPRDPNAPNAGDLENAKKQIALALMDRGEYLAHFSDVLLEALHVVRVEDKSQSSCYGPARESGFDDGTLAAFVRDHDARTSDPPPTPYTTGDLFSSALVLDDLSVIYRAHLFPMVWRPINGANVDELAMERIRRQDFGSVFQSAYIHRDLVCLNCHNSEFSVTYDEDPAKNRAWPVPGYFEQQLYGASNGQHDPSEAPTKGSDELRAISMFKYEGVADGTGPNAATPWNWDSNDCGFFAQPTEDPVLAIDAYFGSVRGQGASVWDVERALHRGVDRLAAHGLVRNGDGTLADPDEAFAYLVAENIVEKIWTEVMGSRLTIANYFPRTRVQRDILFSLTEHFVATHFSLRALLLDIVAHPAFNLKSPDEGCGASAYELPNVFDPWTTSDNDVGKRGNSPADGVFPISSRALVRSLHAAMEWPPMIEYPDQDEGLHDFQAAIGFFVSDSEAGFRGLDFQGRLAFEDRYGACPRIGAHDFIDSIADTAVATSATNGDAVIAVKDRMVGEPSIEPSKEGPLLEALIASPLASTATAGVEGKLRSVCGVLASSPQFMLGGVVPKDTRVVPKIVLPDRTYAIACSTLTASLAKSGYTLMCGSTASVTKP